MASLRLLTRHCLFLATAVCLLGAAVAEDDGGPPPDYGDMFGSQNQVCDLYSCPGGYAPIQKWPISITSTGCQSGGGGMGMMSVGKGEYKHIEHCCHAKNACYQLCGSNKQVCDKEMEKCLVKSCKELPDSKDELDSMSVDEIKKEQDECTKTKGIVELLQKLGGCQEYDMYQRQNCDCVPKDKVAEKMERVLRNFYKKFNPDGIDKVKGLIEKTEGKRAIFNKILNGLVNKYPAAIKKKTVSLEDMMKSEL